MERFILIIICLYLLLTPFYLFPSGQPQPADYLIAFASLIFFLSGKFLQVSSNKVVLQLFKLVLLISLINTTYYIYYLGFQGISNSVYFHSLFYIFNYLLFLIVIYLFSRTKWQKTINTISLFILISLTIQFLLGVLGIHGWTSEERNRPTLFFNNPNQLGYFSLLMLSIFATLPSNYRSNKLYVFFILFVTSYLVLLSGSRAALGGVVLLGALIVVKEGFKFRASSLVFIFAFIATIPVLINSDFVRNRIDLIERRNERYIDTEVSQIQVRAYDRILIHPEYIFFGAGEGLYSRFDSWHKKEIHSAFGTILFSYGVLGLYFFLSFLYLAFNKSLYYNLILFLPIFIYNLTHQGLRTSLFWVLIATIYIVSLQNQNERSKMSNKYYNF